MKKGIPLFILIIILLSACGHKYDVVFEKAPRFEGSVQTPFEIKIKENNKLVSNLNVHASFEMAEMDHGTMKCDLVEQKKGIYEGKVVLPMAGDYDVTFTIDNGKVKKDVLLKIKVDN